MRSVKKLAAAAALFAWPLAGTCQDMHLLRPRDLGRWGVAAGNYSGITPLGGGRYAVVSDKEERDGFFVLHIEQDSLTGQVKRVRDEGFRGTTVSRRGGRDSEGVAFVADDSTVWVSGEADQRVVAFRIDGSPDGRELSVPPDLGIDAICHNYGFEGLGYDAETGLFWTLPENLLKADGGPVKPGRAEQALLRLQSFDCHGRPVARYAYPLDAPQTAVKGRIFAIGAVAVCPAGDGRLWVVEREVDVPRRRMRSRVWERIYEVTPLPGMEWRDGATADDMRGKALSKRLVVAFSTRMRMLRPKYANYEGLCPGATLADGRPTWLLVCDSQARLGRKWCHLRDWIRVIVPSRGTSGE